MNDVETKAIYFPGHLDFCIKSKLEGTKQTELIARFGDPGIQNKGHFWTDVNGLYVGI